MFFKIGNNSTLGEEAHLDKDYKIRMETATVESPSVQIAEFTESKYLRAKELLFEMGFKKDIVLVEQAMRKS